MENKMGLLQEVNDLVIANMNERANKRSNEIADNIRRVAAMGYNKHEIYCWNSNISTIDEKLVIDHLRNEGFDVEIQPRYGSATETVLVIKWLLNGPKQCGQCGRYHQEICKKDGETK